MNEDSLVLALRSIRVMISIFLTSRFSTSKSDSSSIQADERGLEFFNHRLPVFPLEARIPLPIYIMLRGLKIVQGVSAGKARNAIEWRHN